MRSEPRRAARLGSIAEGLQALELHVAAVPAPLVVGLEHHGADSAHGRIRKGAAGHDVCLVDPEGNDEIRLSGERVPIERVRAPAEVIGALG